jgi:hypothetical protein
LFCSCPAFDAYLSAKKWPTDEQKSKAMLTRLDEEVRARFEGLRQSVLFPLALIPPNQHPASEPPLLVPSLNQVVKRTRHALDFRVKKMVAKVSSRRRLRGESKKQKVSHLVKDALIRFLVSKQHLPLFLIPMFQDDDVDFSHRVAKAHVEGVNPLFDGVDWTILLGWDELSPIFSCLQFIADAFVDKPLPGLKKWRDAAAAVLIAFVARDEAFCSTPSVPRREYPRWRKEHPHWRPYQNYKGRRQNLDLRPHKRPVITGAIWNKERDILHIASDADGWGWEIHRFNPHAI